MPPILKVAVPVPLRLVFDYLPPPGIALDTLIPGQRITIPFGPKILTGFLLALEEDPQIAESRLKTAIEVLDIESLQSGSDLKLLIWASRYYHHPIGEVIASAFPVLLRKGHATGTIGTTCYFASAPIESMRAQTPKRAIRQRSFIDQLAKHPKGLSEQTLNQIGWDWHSAARTLLKRGWIERRSVSESEPRATTIAKPDFELNREQQHAVEQVRAGLDRFGIFLLEGITGSGKTEVYFRIIESVLETQKQILVLVPEINLTPQFEARFKSRFSLPIAVFHSGLSEEKRKNSWLQMHGGHSAILLGTRSAVFTPMQRPGLLILDEEHDSSFKQQEGFRFSARDLAIKRAQALDIPVILGSATPSLESIHNANLGRYQHLKLPIRTGSARLPSILLLDIRKQALAGGLAAGLIQEIKKTLARQEQVLLFINRRGYAPTLICHHCGEVARCDRCDSNLVIHAGKGKLCCHHCLSERSIPKNCKSCASEKLVALGHGTERVEQVLAKIFPNAAIARIDRDSTRRKGSLEQALDDIEQGKTEILVGTQMLAKGHHFPNVTLVGILDSDSGLFSTDFRATERLAQLIVQVAGRAGRAHKPGSVIIQTRHPEHPLLIALIRRGYAGFASDALAERKKIGLPPFSFQALFRAEAKDPETPLTFLKNLRDAAESVKQHGVEILGPVQAPMAKRLGRYRYQLLLQSPSRARLHQELDTLLSRMQSIAGLSRVRWSLDIDPMDLF